MHESKQSSTQTMIAALWQRNQPQVLERLALLDQAAAEPLTPQLRQDAVATAHKLAGSLGMFGFHEGTRLARELELLLESPAVDTGTVRTLTAQLRQSLFPNGKIIA
jgi:HPt (histidine-containing phosphotransfer) domain-containing protein